MNPSMSLTSQHALDLLLTQMIFSSLSCFYIFRLNFLFSSFVSPTPDGAILSFSELFEELPSSLSSDPWEETDSDLSEMFSSSPFCIILGSDLFFYFSRSNYLLFSFSTCFRNFLYSFCISLILSSWDWNSSWGLKVWIIIDLKSFDNLNVALYLSKMIGIPLTV